MSFYLSQWKGSGTRLDSFVPIAASGTWSAIDLRPDVTISDGFALVWTEKALTTIPTGAWLLADTPDSGLSIQVRNTCASVLGITLDPPITFRQAMRQILTTEATGPEHGRWRKLSPYLGKLKLSLGELEDMWEA